MEEKKIFEKRWQLAKIDQRQCYHELLEKYPDIDWTYREREYLLWLCQLDIKTIEAFEGIFEKLAKKE